MNILSKVRLLAVVIGCFSMVQCTGETANETEEPQHDDLMETLFEEPKYNIKTIGILVYDGVNDLDFTGPKYVLGNIMGAEVLLIGKDKKEFTTVTGMSVIANTVIDSVKQLDILVIPGGAAETAAAAKDSTLLNWIRKIDETSVFTTSVCTGGWILGASGLLEGRKATTNWYRAEEKLQQYGATFTNERFSNDGKYWTSAGVSAGIDMSLAIVNEIYGKNYTQAIMLDMEYDPMPPVQGGSPEKTDKGVVEMMTGMYDSVFETEQTEKSDG